MDAIAGYDDEDEEEAPEVTLDIGGGQEITSAAWCDLPEEQADENWKPALGRSVVGGDDDAQRGGGVLRPRSSRRGDFSQSVTLKRYVPSHPHTESIEKWIQSDSHTPIPLTVTNRATSRAAVALPWCPRAPAAVRERAASWSECVHVAAFGAGLRKSAARLAHPLPHPWAIVRLGGAFLISRRVGGRAI